MKIVEVGEEVRKNYSSEGYSERRKVTQVVLRGKPITFNGKIKYNVTEFGQAKFPDFDHEFKISHSLAVLVAFLDLPDDPRDQVFYGSKERTDPDPNYVYDPSDLFSGHNLWGITICMNRTIDPHRFSERWYKYVARMHSNKLHDWESGLPLLEIRRYWDYDDSAEGYTCHIDRRYSVQIHRPFALNFGRDAIELRRLLSERRKKSPVSMDGSRTPYSHTDNKGFLSLEEIAKEQEVRDAVITLMRTHPVWSGRRLSLYGLK